MVYTVSMRRHNGGYYSTMEAGHDVDISRVRYGPWAGWWKLFVDGEDSGWHWETKQRAMAEAARYVDGYIRMVMGRP